MITKKSTFFTGLLVALLVMIFAVPTALAKGPEGGPEGQRGPRRARILITVAAEEIGLTPRELIAELREEEGRSIADVANEHGVNPDDIVEAVVAKASERLAERVAEGDLTQEEMDERLTTIQEKVTEIINKPFPARGERPPRGPRGARILITVAAEEMGLTPRELIAELREEEGRSIADVANEHGVNPDEIVEAVVAKASERLAERVAEGDLTQEEMDERLATIREKVTEVINSPFPARGERPHHGQRRNN